MIGNWYEIEEWVPPENAIGGKGYWFPLNSDQGDYPYRGSEFYDTLVTYKRLREQGREVRIVWVRRQVMEMAEKSK